MFLGHVGDLSALDDLFLMNTSVTDAGLTHLKGSNLRELALIDTQVTQEGVEKLQQALPTCWISH